MCFGRRASVFISSWCLVFVLVFKNSSRVGVGAGEPKRGHLGVPFDGVSTDWTFMLWFYLASCLLRIGAPPIHPQYIRRSMQMYPLHIMPHRYMELPSIKWIISVVLFSTINVPPAQYIRPYKYSPPCSVHDKAQQRRVNISQLIMNSYHTLKCKLENQKMKLKTESLSNLKIENQILQFKPSKPQIRSSNSQVKKILVSKGNSSRRQVKTSPIISDETNCNHGKYDTMWSHQKNKTKRKIYR